MKLQPQLSHTHTYTEYDVAVIDRVHAGVGGGNDDTKSDNDIIPVLNIGRQTDRRGGDISSFSGEDGDRDNLTSGGGCSGISRSERRIPFPNCLIDEGKKNGGDIIRCAKRVGFDLALKHGNQGDWFKERGGLFSLD